jgi:hypothetical protein
MTLPRIMVVGASSWSSRLIEDFGQWSHMANLLDDGTALDARFDHVTYQGKKYSPGVQLRPAHYLDSQPRWAVFEFGTPEMYEPWLQAGLGQIGKPYDSRGIMGFVSGLLSGSFKDREYAPQNPAKSKAWFCDELSLFMAWRGCGYLKLPENFLPYRQTPGAALNLWLGAGAKLVASRG